MYQVEDYWNILKLNCRPLAFISCEAFLKKQRSATSPPASFSAWFLQIFFFNFHLTALQPTLGHYRGNSLTHPMLLCFYNFDQRVTGNPFSINAPLLYLLKTSENWRFSDAFRGYRRGTLVENRLKYKVLLKSWFYLHITKIITSHLI